MRWRCESTVFGLRKRLSAASRLLSPLEIAAATWSSAFVSTSSGLWAVGAWRPMITAVRSSHGRAPSAVNVSNALVRSCSNRPGAAISPINALLRAASNGALSASRRSADSRSAAGSWSSRPSPRRAMAAAHSLPVSTDRERTILDEAPRIHRLVCAPERFEQIAVPPQAVPVRRSRPAGRSPRSARDR